MNTRVAGATVAVAIAVTLSVSAGASASAQQQAAGDQATVSVLHAVPGLTVDVYAGDKELIPDFKPGTLTDPMKLDAGSYDIKIFKEGEGPDGSPAIEKKVDVPAGANATLVAHLTADGKPALDAFVNDVSKIPAGKARLTVRHVAAAPAVDVRANGKAVFKGLENPKEAKGEVAAGTVSADVVLAGTDTVAIGPAKLNLAEGTNTVVYAWGSADDKNLQLKVQSLTGMHSAPSGVPAGETGAAAAHNEGLPLGALSLGAVSALSAAGLFLRLRRTAR
ncbi:MULTISPECIES: DUF4397 domain-containing protein [Streptomyces]|uniref:DUF4397 domain-containing protein n=1 Tax=Streptomyces gilvifuscus TaxID=1550617 RepID=A0ABT5FZL0_9ACTN|nr:MULTISPECIES: DUF4397 domain-containing protein [Streptomyces]MBK3640030.1 DUF4397 domain-containing protein [Streptomyces sp. MBT33]MDC2958005.1 DUF4397 domain-containing protein [Streptomyces gilvifuscus]